MDESTQIMLVSINTTTINYKNSNRSSYNWAVLLLFIIVIFAISGNILTILAVRYERKLQSMFNYFLVSLALSDTLSATLVMPVSIIRELYADVYIPKHLCITWYSFDVFFTSSTIIHLTMISIDRYLVLKYPFKYGHAKSTKQMLLKISAVWIISFCIGGPLFVLTMFDPKIEVTYKGCGPETMTFVVTATVISFYLPLLINAVMYIMTVKALFDQIKSQKKLSKVKEISNSTSKVDNKYLNENKRRNNEDNEVFENSLPNDESTSCRNSDHGIEMKLLTPNRHIKDEGKSISASTSRIFSNGSRKVRRDKGKQAVLVLGVLFLVFIFCYLPFFTAYLINATCMSCQPYISDKMLMTFEWMGYSGAMVNPFIYHIFNPEFRHTYYKLILCKCLTSQTKL